jgi:hypothetical protein
LKADKCCFGCSSWLMVAAVASGSWPACPVLPLSGPARGGVGFGSWLINSFFVSSVMLKAGGWLCVVDLERCGAWWLGEARSPASVDTNTILYVNRRV